MILIGIEDSMLKVKDISTEEDHDIMKSRYMGVRKQLFRRTSITKKE